MSRTKRLRDHAECVLGGDPGDLFLCPTPQPDDLRLLEKHFGCKPTVHPPGSPLSVRYHDRFRCVQHWVWVCPHSLYMTRDMYWLRTTATSTDFMVVDVGTVMGTVWLVQTYKGWFLMLDDGVLLHETTLPQLMEYFDDSNKAFLVTQARFCAPRLQLPGLLIVMDVQAWLRYHRRGFHYVQSLSRFIGYNILRLIYPMDIEVLALSISPPGKNPSENGTKSPSQQILEWASGQAFKDIQLDQAFWKDWFNSSAPRYLEHHWSPCLVAPQQYRYMTLSGQGCLLLNIDPQSSQYNTIYYCAASDRPRTYASMVCKHPPLLVYHWLRYGVKVINRAIQVNDRYIYSRCNPLNTWRFFHRVVLTLYHASLPMPVATDIAIRYVCHWLGFDHGHYRDCPGAGRTSSLDVTRQFVGMMAWFKGRMSSVPSLSVHS